MKSLLLATTMLMAVPALADDTDTCRQQSADMLEVGRILVDDMKNDSPEIAQWRLRALMLLCMGGGARVAEPAYEIKLKPPAPAKKATKKATSWQTECRKFISLNEKDWTVVTTTSAPARVPCPAKPKE